MKNRTLLIVATGIISMLVACMSPEQKSLERLKKMEIAVSKDTAKNPDKAKIHDLMMGYKNFADSFPKNDSIPEYLFRAGKLASGLNYTMDALHCYKQVYEKFPTSKRAPFSLFMIGFIYENQIRHPELAKKTYEEFMAKFPTHELAKDVKFSLDHLGKSDEELIKEFEAKQKI
ncbi:MAG: tetratricopeptide repeat protein [Bacteroidota bacterium]